MVWCHEQLSPTDISAGYQHRLDNKTGSEVHSPKCFGQRNNFYLRNYHTWNVIITEFNCSKPQSNKCVHTLFDCYGVEEDFQLVNLLGCDVGRKPVTVGYFCIAFLFETFHHALFKSREESYFIVNSATCPNILEPMKFQTVFYTTCPATVFARVCI